MHPQMKNKPINESNPKTPPLRSDSIPKHWPFREKSKIYERGGHTSEREKPSYRQKEPENTAIRKRFMSKGARIPVKNTVYSAKNRYKR